MTKTRMTELYFEWLCEKIGANRDNDLMSYNELLLYLFKEPFIYTMGHDSNRYEDGIYLRYQFAYDKNFDQRMVASYLDQSDCSMLEMMVALSIRCEDTMSDPEEYGDRTGEWFWNMIESLGLIEYDDENFDSEEVEMIVDIFNNREYRYDGEGGLFTIYSPPEDLRKVEIWTQMCWYLNTIPERRCG